MLIPLFKPLKYPSLYASDNNYLNHNHRYINNITTVNISTSSLIFMGLLINRLSNTASVPLDAPTFDPPAGEID